MTMNPELLYLQLTKLVETMPYLDEALTPETQRWLGRASALVSEVDGLSSVDVLSMNLAITNLASANRINNEQAIIATVHRALALAERNAPASMQGAFIAAGNTFDAFAAFGKAVAQAKIDVLIVDPYMDEVALTDFALLAPDGVAIRLLADKHDRKPTLEPAVRRWSTQFKTRPLEARLSPARTLHDRLVLVDSKDVWNLSQSLNLIARRAHASISRFDTDIAAMKLAAYEELWRGATPI